MRVLREGATAMILALLALTGSLAGCARFRQCGLAGCPDDARITRDVRLRLTQYPSLEAPNSVRVQTSNHVVYLYGQVNNELERAMAEEVALSIAGVSRVVDSISLDNVGR
jgi:osmotically-inducible protein OsmY